METVSHYRLNLYNVSISYCQPSPQISLDFMSWAFSCFPGSPHTWALAYCSVSPHPSGVTTLGFISDLPFRLHEVNFGVTLSQEQQKRGRVLSTLALSQDGPK